MPIEGQHSRPRRRVDLDVLRPRGGKQPPGAGDDLRIGPDDDEKLAPLDLCLVFERRSFGTHQATSAPARLPSAVPATVPSNAASSAAEIGPATTTKPSPGRIRNPAPMNRPNSPPNHAPVSAPALA